MDKGLWRVLPMLEDYSHLVVVSDDFSRDVTLEITGDFADDDERLAYCEWLAGVLNKATAPDNPPAP